MRIDFTKRPPLVDGVRDSERPHALCWCMIDRETGQDITPRNLRWADDITGEYEVVLRDSQGRALIDPDSLVIVKKRFLWSDGTVTRVPCRPKPKVATEIRKGNFRLEYRPA